MNLIIVESPTKARTLSRFLGKDYVLEATMGHIKDLPKSKLGVDVESDFSPDYLPIKDKSESIKEIMDQAKKTRKIFIATDPDREGEAIAQHVCEILTRKDAQYPNIPISRIVFHEITKDAVEKAIKHPQEINKDLVDAQIARRVLDRLVGYKLSPLLWKKVRRGLSAGRVQSVAVRLIVEREREIEAFVPEEFWEIFCEVKSKPSSRAQVEGRQEEEDSKFAVKLIKIDDKKAKIENEKTAKNVVSDLKLAEFSIMDVKKREVRKNPFPPFTTSTMTQASARLYRWSTKRTMNIAQRLYEEGLITYHRTDSTNIAKAALDTVRDFITKEYGDLYLPQRPRLYKTKSRLAQEAHEAIRPTDVAKTEVEAGKIGKDMGMLYRLVWKRFVACQMVASLYDETTIDVSAIKETRNYLLRTTGQIMKFDGWKTIYGGITNDKSPATNGEKKLPDVRKNEQLKLIKVNPIQKFTEPPARYGEASLVKTLEKLGIGRPSTYAPVISTIQTRNYVEKKEGKFYPTPVGVAVNDFLVTNFTKIFEYSFTAAMEDDLDNIAKGKKRWIRMMKEFYGPFESKLAKVEDKSKRVKIEAEKLGKKCPKCDKGELVIRIGRFGKFISCSRFPDCDHREKYIEKIGVKCPECIKGDVIIRKTRKGKKFYGCSRYPKCKWASWRKPKVS